jgi:hypothetical protein
MCFPVSTALFSRFSTCRTSPSERKSCDSQTASLMAPGALESISLQLFLILNLFRISALPFVQMGVVLEWP